MNQPDSIARISQRACSGGAHAYHREGFGLNPGDDYRYAPLMSSNEGELSASQMLEVSRVT